MKIEVRNYRGVERADINLERITLVAGRNFMGKSSICQAVGAALSGNAIPMIRFKSDGSLGPAFAKSDSGLLVRAGYDKGSVRIIDQRNLADGPTTVGELEIKWPDPEPMGKGSPPLASAYAAGLISLVDMDEKSRVKALTELLSADPADEDVTLAFTEIAYKPERIEKLIATLKEQGWDATHTMAVENGQKLKGEWRGVTGQNYGKDKAPKWVPEAWTEDLAEVTEEALTQAAVDAQKALEQALAATAVDERELDTLRSAAEVLPTFQQELADAEADQKKKALAHQSAVAKRVPVEPEGLTCPHCNEPVTLVKGKLTKGGKKPPKKAKADAIEAEVTAAFEALRDADQKVSDIRSDLKTAQDAADRLAKMRDKTPGAGGDPDTARQAVDLSLQRIGAFREKTKADRLHNSIERNQIAIDLLSPGGLRKRALLRALERFNAVTTDLSKIAAFKDVTIDEEMTVRYGGRMLIHSVPDSKQLVSVSECFRVRAILQIAIASFDRSDVVVLDGVDVLDGKGRNGLFALLKNITEGGLKVLVGMTTTQDGAPDLAKVGLGETYFIEDGIARPLNELAKAA